MPIKKELRPLYPPNWKEISHYIRFVRGRGKCDFCGAEHGKPNPITGSIVFLTAAHLDQNPANNDDENLASLCQLCHNWHDRPYRKRNARRTVRRRYALGDLFDRASAP